jgi:hypothetical protein
MHRLECVCHVAKGATPFSSTREPGTQPACMLSILVFALILARQEPTLNKLMLAGLCTLGSDDKQEGSDGPPMQLVLKACWQQSALTCPYGAR